MRISTQTGGQGDVALPAATEQLNSCTMFTHSANAGSQIGHNSGSIVNHIYGPTSSNGHMERAPKRRKMDQTGLSNAQEHFHITQEDGDHHADRYDSLHQSLLFDRIDFRVKNVKKELLTTCEWLLTHPYFKTWWADNTLDEQNGFLWIKGKPGCGKSTLMKAALDWTRTRIIETEEKRVIIPYFFNARASGLLEKSSLGLYRTVVYQLLSFHQPLRSLFTDSFALKDPGSSGQKWTREELQGLLSDVVESNEDFKLLLFIDALDEAEYEDDVRDMIAFLVQLSDRATASGSCHIRVCLSSRHYPHISIGRGLSLIVEEQPGHGRDIKQYISKQLICQVGAEKDELSDSIFNKSARIFLWVVLVVRLLNQLNDRGAAISDMRARLRTIPIGLDELFHEILIKIDEGIENSILLLQWMMFRLRALEPEELFLAIEYSKAFNEPRQTPSTMKSVPPADRLTKFILNYSRGLVEIVKIAPSKPPVVQFIHETVREFLMKEKALASLNPALSTNLAGTSHEIFRTACLRYVTINTTHTEYEHYKRASHQNDAECGSPELCVRRKLPFLNYAISYLFGHAEQAHRYGIPQQAFLNTQIDQVGGWSDPLQLWWNVFRPCRFGGIDSNCKLLYFAIDQEYSSLVPVLLDVLDNTETVCRHYSTTLELASRRGLVQVIQWLMKKSIDVSAWGNCLGKAVQVASENGHTAVVKALLDAGADVDAPSGRYRSPHKAASYRGHEKVVQTLLDAGADVNALGRYYGSPLQAASCRGCKRVVQILLDAGADVNAPGRCYGSALQTASYNGHEKVVQILLDAGADVNAPGVHYGNALQAAIHYGHTAVVKVLLEKGADINALDRCYGSPLQAASYRGQEKVVQILLDAGADVNAQGGDFGSALKAALYCRHWKIVQMLLEKGADAHGQGREGGSIVQATS